MVGFKKDFQEFLILLQLAVGAQYTQETQRWPAPKGNHQTQEGSGGTDCHGRKRKEYRPSQVEGPFILCLFGRGERNQRLVETLGLCSRLKKNLDYWFI